MPRVAIPFVGGAYLGRSIPQDPQECVNFFLETDKEGGKSPLALYCTPGLKTWKDTGTSAEIRGMVVCQGKLYVVAGSDLLQIQTDLTQADLGDLDTSTGIVRMVASDLEVMAVDDADGYVYTIATAAFAKLTSDAAVACTFTDTGDLVGDVAHGLSDGDWVEFKTIVTTTGLSVDTTYYVVNKTDDSFQVATVAGGTPITLTTDGTGTYLSQLSVAFPANVRGLTYQDTYAIVTVKDSDDFYISGANDFTAWDALDYSSADGAPGDLLAVMSDHRELWLFKEESTEVWYNAGAADFPFVRVQGAFLETGIAGPNCYAKLDNTVYWLTNLGVVVAAAGYNPQVVSTRQLEYQWSGYTWSDCIFFAYHWQGHALLQITFPTDGYTYVFDASNGTWHRRTSYPTNGRHRANCYAFFNGKHLVGDFENGIIYEIDWATYTDNSETITRWRTTTVFNDKDVNLFCHSVQVDFEAGIGLISGQGSDPQAALQWSDDGGRTWSSETWRSIGGYSGEYHVRSIWRRLGVGRNRVLKLTVTDPVKWVITGAVAEVTAGTH